MDDDFFTPLADLATDINNTSIGDIPDGFDLPEINNSKEAQEQLSSFKSSLKEIIFLIILFVVLNNKFMFGILEKLKGINSSSTINYEEKEVITKNISFRGTLILSLFFIIGIILIKLLCYLDFI